MARTTPNNILSEDGRLMYGFDYDNQAWVHNGKYVRCGHPDSMNCGCYGKEHEGEKTLPTKQKGKN